MRDIKFRHYDKHLNDFLIFELLPVGIARDETIVSFDKDRASSPIEQFTGLLDKQGNEIYEGDIFNDGIAYCVIKWNADTASFVSFDGDENHEVGCYLKNEIIIGNIYQNPELLNA